MDIARKRNIRLAIGLLAAIAVCSSATAQSPTGTLVAPHAVQCLCEPQPGVVLLCGSNAISRLATDRVTASVVIQLDAFKIAQAVCCGPSIVLAGAQKIEYGFVAKLSEDLETMQWVAAELPSRVICVAANQQHVAVGCEDGSISCFDAETGTKIWNQQTHSKMITAACIVSSGSLPDAILATGDWTGKIVVTELANGREVHSMSQHRDRITALDTWTSPTKNAQTRLYSASRDGTVRLWYPAQRRLVRFVQLPNPITAIKRLEGDQVLAFQNSGQMVQVDLATAEVSPTWPSPLPHVTSTIVVDGTLFCTNGTQQVSSTPIAKLFVAE